MKLCKEFGWTPSELEEQDDETIQKYIAALNGLYGEKDGRGTDTGSKSQDGQVQGRP